MYYLNHYKIDWEKVEGLEDIKRILKALDISFEPNSYALNSIKDLVVLVTK